MRRLTIARAAPIALAGLFALSAPARADDAPAAHWGMLESYCETCHNAEDWAGGVAFDTMNPAAIPADAEIWETAVRKLRGGLMPPPGEPRPDPAEIDGFVSWMEATLDAAPDRPVAGHVPVQRLNRAEYAAAVKGLLGVDIDARTVLPTEVEVDGFDNIAEALGTSPIFLEQYIAAARSAARLAVGDPLRKQASVYYPSPGGAQATHEDGMPLGTRGGVVFHHVFPADGDYKINILDLDIGLYPRSAESRSTLLLLIDGEEVSRQDVGGPEDLAAVDRDGDYARIDIMKRFQDIPVTATAGPHDVAIAFIERARVATDDPIAVGATGNFGAGLPRLSHVINGVEINGPFESPGISLSPSRALLFVCEPGSEAEERPCAEAITRRLAERAFRRPVTDDDLAFLMPFYDWGRKNGAPFDAGIESMVTAVLASPDFLYRSIAPPADPGAAKAFALSDLELASRLSFFLWNQGPDAELIEAASAGRLHDDAALEAEVRRMLKDPRARSLVTDFALKWLNLDDLGAVEPNGQAFPGFSGELRTAFAEELELFLASVLLEDRSVLGIVGSDTTFVNETLARHYGIPGVRGDQFREVKLQDEARWGILGKGGMLLRTSYGDRTSPVLRGAWVLDKLMGTPPTPPPPNVNTDLSVPTGQKVTTIRARLERHREDPGCNACHGVIDPWGIALENFDVTGRWRDVDHAAGAPIDASTVLSTGEAIAGPAALRKALLAKPDQLVQNLTEKLMMYGLGRELEYYDMPQVRAIVRAAAKDDYRFSSIVLGVVRSDAFRMQAVADMADNKAVQGVH